LQRIRFGLAAEPLVRRGIGIQGTPYLINVFSVSLRH
jgi:hypothetical protein